MIHITAAAVTCACAHNDQDVEKVLRESKNYTFCHDLTLLQDAAAASLAKVQLPLLFEKNIIEKHGLNEHNSRNNRLLLHTVLKIKAEIENALQRYAQDRIAVIVGTSTSGQDEADAFISNRKLQDNVKYAYSMQELGDPACFLKKLFDLKGPAYTISTACTSSARALISASRLLRSDLCDCVIVAGCDTLNRMTINGFHSMGVLSESECTPFAKGRNGISIGEGAGVMLLSKDGNCDDVFFKGYGESSDAYHISSPDPDAFEAVTSMRDALKRAQLSCSDIDYLNLHGTGTLLNDAMESKAVKNLFTKIPCSSTKHFTGHTLGACGIIEACFLYILLKNPDCPLPAQDFSLKDYDDKLGEFGLLKVPSSGKKRHNMMSNSFAFGGNNVSIILGIM
ncbi:MAG: beta-ketoacyl-ACP synthase [Succinatimonas sp.]|nr:beta-ketoacyl-ACP synthase [Succinatimonas sp.]